MPLSQARGRDRAAEHPARHPYEDDDLLIVDKPAGMVVHPGHGNWDGTLVNALTYHLRTLPMFREGDLRAGLVHRIDKDTSGLLVVAKNERAHARLAKQFFDHTIVRRYYAPRVGQSRRRRGDDRGQYRPFAEGQVADVRLRGRRAGASTP